MLGPDEQFEGVDDIQLDRLVDGELDDHARRQLLLALEEEPSGWRRCALAYVEAQSWGGDLQAIMNRSVGETVDKPVTTQRRWGSTLVSSLTMAACIAVAFTLGAFWRINMLPGTPSVAEQPSPESSTDSPSRQPAAHRPAHELAESPLRSPGNTLRRDRIDDFDLLTVVVEDGDRSGAFQVPLLDTHAAADTVDWDPSSRFSPALLKRLEELGHRVQTRRRYAPFPLEDGRQWVVPVDDVEIVPVGRRVY